MTVSFYTVQNYKNQKNFESFKKAWRKNKGTCQRRHVQYHVHANKSRYIYALDVWQLPSPVYHIWIEHSWVILSHGPLLPQKKSKTNGAIMSQGENRLKLA